MRPVSLVLEVVPLFILFELSIWLSVWMDRRWERVAWQRDWDDDDDLT